MRTLDQIASEKYSEHTAKDIAVLAQVRRETVEDLCARVRTFNPMLAANLEQEFWLENPK